MKRWLACSLIGTLSAAALASTATVGCGGSTQNGPGDGGTDTGITHPEDSGHPGDSSSATDSPSDGKLPPLDSSTTDSPTGIPLEGGPPVSSMSVSLVNLEKAGLTGGVQLIGVTDDNKDVIYFGTDGSGVTSVYAVPVAGGTATKILATAAPTDSGAGGAEVVLAHSTVFIWNNTTTSMATGNVVGQLTVWTEANGAISAGTGESTAGIAAASPDNTHVVFSTGVPSAGTTGNIVAATTAAPATQTVLLTATITNAVQSTPPAAPVFVPELGFPTNTSVVISHQETSSATIAISTFDTTSWTKVDLVATAAAVSANTPAWDTSTKGTAPGASIVTLDGSGNLLLIPTIGGAAVTIDTGVTTFYEQLAGDSVLYGKGGALLSNTLPVPTVATTIVPATGFGGFINFYGPVAESPDETETIFYTKLSSTGGQGGSDLNLVANTASATVAKLLTGTTGTIFSDAFTADSHYALYFTALTTVASVPPGAVGDMTAWDIAAGKSLSISTMSVWDGNGLSGSLVLYNDNFTLLTPNSPGVADIKTVDISATTLSPTTIQLGADANYYLTTDKSQLVFSLQDGNQTTDGIYAYPL